jgi:exonuclease SbcC
MGKKALSIENSNSRNKTKLLVSKELAHFSAQIHDGENCPVWIWNIPM